MESVCPVCLAMQVHSLLCSACCDRLERDLGDVAAIVAELDVTLSRQDRIGEAGKSGSGWAREKSPLAEGAIDPRWVLSNVLTTWARDVSNETWLPAINTVRVTRNREVAAAGPFCPRCVHRSCQALRTQERRPAPPLATQAAGYLLSEIPLIRRHPAVEELVDEITDVIRLARRTVDRPSDRAYFGACYADTPDENGQPVTCLEEIWARPWASEVTCRVCGTTHEIAERRAWLLERAQDMIVTVPDAATYMGDVGHIKVTQASIRGYLFRHRIAYRAPVEAKRIRLGDLIAVVLEDSEKAERRAG